MGEWIERDPGYLSFDVYNCTYCGKLIPRHIWLEEVEGKSQPFCAPNCHQRYMQRQQSRTQSLGKTNTAATSI